MKPNDLVNLTDEELAEVPMGVKGSSDHTSVMLEWRRRMAFENIKAAKATAETADLVKATAKWTRFSAISTAVAAASTAAAAIVTVCNALKW